MPILDNYNFTASEKELIRRSRETFYGNIIPRKEGEPYVFNDRIAIQPSPSTYKGVWNWDAAFHLLGMTYYDAIIARDQARIMFDYMLPDGQLPDVVFTSGRVVTRFTKPPVFAWAIMRSDMLIHDTEFLNYAYPYLKRNFEWWNRARFDGILYSYKVSRMESGWDNTVRFDFPHIISFCYAVDLNSYMVTMLDALIYIAERTGKSKDIPIYRKSREKLLLNINKFLYNEKKGWYSDYNKLLRLSTGRLSPASFMPLFAGIANEEQAAKMMKLAEDKEYFYNGMPTIAYNCRGFRSGNYWRGTCWLNTAYFAIKGLADYGYSALANGYIGNILNWCGENTDSIYEYYDSLSGKGLGAKKFGWSAVFITELILLKHVLNK